MVKTCSVNPICPRPRTPLMGLPRFPANAAHAGGDFLICAAMRARRPIKKRTGKRFGKLTALSFSHFNKYNRAVWLCLCDCGNTHKVEGASLASGKTKSCGCHKAYILSGADRITHGESIGGIVTPEYRAWSNMKNRCANSKCDMYYRYGGRGIQVCKRWAMSFQNFLADMGRKPTQKHSIDRKRINGNYTPSNCRWATAKEQSVNTSRNKFLEYNGERKTISQWCAHLGLSGSGIHCRIYNGWSLKKALSTPSRRLI